MDFKALGRQIKLAFSMQDIIDAATANPHAAGAIAGGLGGAGLGALIDGGKGALTYGLAGAALGTLPGHVFSQLDVDRDKQSEVMKALRYLGLGEPDPLYPIKSTTRTYGPGEYERRNEPKTPGEPPAPPPAR